MKSVRTTIAQKTKSKIVWTIHNLKSHSVKFSKSRQAIRELLFEYTNLVFVMRFKHLFLVPENCKKKFRVVPHYLEANPYGKVEGNITPTIFRYEGT